VESEFLSRRLVKLARLFSVDRGYHDIWGNYRSCSAQSLIKVLLSMGIPAESEADVDSVAALKRTASLEQVVPPVKVVFSGEGELKVVLTVPVDLEDQKVKWVLTYEDGATAKAEESLKSLKSIRTIDHDSKQWRRYQLVLPVGLPLGYHELKVSVGQLSGFCQLISAPKQCYQPPEFADNNKLWGIASQLYSLRSSRNWGLGQFSDLNALIRIVSEAGGAFVGLNPFNAVSVFNMDQNSPYSATSRSFLNVYYMDCEAMPDVQESSQAREVIASPKFQQKITQLRQSEQVQYRDVRALKNPVFELAYEYFASTHLANDSERAAEFYSFVEERGDLLEKYAVYEALGMHMWKPDFSCWGWPVWKEEFQDVDSPAVAEFAEEHREDINYFKYLQWQAHCQLQDTVKRCAEAGLPFGLYVDFALSGDRGGCDIWRDKELYALSASVGAPPDDYNLLGQDWGFSPLIPQKMRESAYRPFVEALQANMKYAGAIRIDHAMSMMRLFWIPESDGADKGVYVRYPYRDLMGIVCLESVRNKCVVICEDLGTVPDVFREQMKRFGMLSYKVFFFMKTGPIDFAAPDAYPEDSLVTGTTHDMFTVWGYWQNLDLKLRNDLELLTGPPLEEQIARREQEKRNMLEMLKSQDLLPKRYDIEAALDELDDQVAVAIEAFLARTPCRILALPIEDLCGQLPQVNLPGTTSETYPCWRHRVPVNLQDIPGLKRFKALKKVFEKEGRMRGKNSRV
jgi:(1->4)-alpha-D-glucan 1-alpha-D-glucosylmutase